MIVRLGRGYASCERTPGPDRIYDAEAAKDPMPPRGPFGFNPPKAERDPETWEGDNA